MNSTNRPFRAVLTFTVPLMGTLAALSLSGCHPSGATETKTAAATPATGPVHAASLPTPGSQHAASNAQHPTPDATPESFAPPPEGVRAIYLTGWSAGQKTHLAKLVAFADRTEINAMVIDVKDDGEVSYDMDVPLVKSSHASRRMFRASKLMDTLKKHHIYPIARIACMRDSVLPKTHPELCVQTAGGKAWRDATRHGWLNPCDKRVWDYNVDVALDAIKHGFKEIQFDYVRFPSEGKLGSLVYKGKTKDREEYIADFMKYARDKIKATGAMFSADVFGLTSLVKNDEGIGQKFEKVIQPVDYLCPMVYPSHYHKGEYHIPDPDLAPYKIVHLSVGDAVRRLNKSKEKNKELKCQVRPWLQAFSLGNHYGPAQLKAEIKAINDVGIHEFLLWNAGCNYAIFEPALKKQSETTNAVKTVSSAPAPKSASPAAVPPAKTAPAPH